MKSDKALFHFRVAIASVSKRVLVRNHSYENVFPKSFSYESFGSKTRFETAAQTSTKMAFRIPHNLRGLHSLCMYFLTTAFLYVSCFRKEFKHDVKQPGGESIILENENLKVEFESLRGLLKVIRTLFYSHSLHVHFTNTKIKCNVSIDTYVTQSYFRASRIKTTEL